MCLLWGALVALAVAAGGLAQGGPADGGGPAGTGPSAIGVYAHPQYGDILVDGAGRVLYIFHNDEPGAASVCEGPCAERWPPVPVEGDGPASGDGVLGSLGVATRADGSRQLTYEGMPLYYWFQDDGPGVAKGQGVAGVWFVVPTDPAQRQAPTLEAARHPQWGQYLVDTYGRALYMFERDAAGESNCYDRCAETWPPLLGIPGTGPAVSAEVGGHRRKDGQVQAVVAGMPLYYFAADQYPGDIQGQGFRDVWFLVSPEGQVLRPEAGAGADVAAATDGAGEPGAATVDIRDFAFAPGELRVKAGTTVVWHNHDSAPHTVRSVGPARTLDSPVMTAGMEFRFTFNEPGRYDYYCTVHPAMRASVIVE